MRKLVIALALIGLSACHKSDVAVPTVAEFAVNPTLLKSWLGKCATGEYSHLSVDETGKMCGSAWSARDAEMQAVRAKNESALFHSNTLRK